MIKKIIKRSRVKIPHDSEILQLYRNTRPELYKKSIVEKIKLPLNALSRYPDIDSFLIKLSTFINIDVKNIMLSSGIDGAIKTIMETLLEPGSKIALLTPTYKMYEVYAKLYELNLIKISSKQNLTIDIKDILKVIPSVKLIFIPNPHEPIENIFSREQIIEIVKQAEKYGVFVVIDEAYFMFGAPTVIDIAPRYNNLLVMRTFSKGFGLPAIRLGYTIGEKKLISRLLSGRFAYETNSLSMGIAEWALKNLEIFNKYIEEIIEMRSFLKAKLLNKNFQVHGSFSNTILINMQSKKKALEIYKKLKSANIWVREFTKFPNVGSWISVTIGQKITMEKFLKTFFSI